MERREYTLRRVLTQRPTTSPPSHWFGSGPFHGLFLGVCAVRVEKSRWWLVADSAWTNQRPDQSRDSYKPGFAGSGFHRSQCTALAGDHPVSSLMMRMTRPGDGRRRPWDDEVQPEVPSGHRHSAPPFRTGRRRYPRVFSRRFPPDRERRPGAGDASSGTVPGDRRGEGVWQFFPGQVEEEDTGVGGGCSR